ncbi:MAG TPA: hypothetical protein VGL34_00490 [Steroidobacteraceae bacterium]|jgi:alkylation response protein AidB-like acyl-CoA dehydrogenase
MRRDCFNYDHELSPKVLMVASNLGGAYEITEFVQHRKLFGKALSEHQNTRVKKDSMRTELEEAQTYVDHRVR